MTSTVIPTAMSRLAVDPDPNVRLAIATHDAVEPEVLASLVNDEDPVVRMAVALHPSADALGLRALLANDPDQTVADTARHYPCSVGQDWCDAITNRQPEHSCPAADAEEAIGERLYGRNGITESESQDPLF